MQFVVASGSGTGFYLKCFLCPHHTTKIPFSFICYVQNLHWACERPVVWRHTHTHACTLKQQCAWSDEHLQSCCAMRVSQQPVPFQLRFFLHMCMVGRIFVLFPSALFLFPNFVNCCLYRCTVHSVVYLINTPTNAHIYVI